MVICMDFRVPNEWCGGFPLSFFVLPTVPVGFSETKLLFWIRQRRPAIRTLNTTQLAQGCNCFYSYEMIASGSWSLVLLQMNGMLGMDFVWERMTHPITRSRNQVISTHDYVSKKPLSWLWVRTRQSRFFRWKVNINIVFRFESLVNSYARA